MVDGNGGCRTSVVLNGSRFFISTRFVISSASSDTTDQTHVPATSTDAEQAFSQGGLTVSRMRHSLSDNSVQAATVVGSWATFPGLIPHNEIAAIFNEKSKRLKGKCAETTSDAILVE